MPHPFEIDPKEYRRLGLPVGLDEQGQRVDQYLATSFPFLSRSGWCERLKRGELRVGGRSVRPSYRLRLGDVFDFFHPEHHEPEVEGDVRILWQEGPVLCASKPPHLPMHEGGPYRKNTFAAFIKRVAGEEWSAVHRLDRETSGIVLCGATDAVRRQLAEQFRNSTVSKEYLALVRGRPEKDGWQVDQPIADLECSEIRIKKWVVEGGQSALTRFVCEWRGGDFSLLRALPKTGRTNQIRIHAAYSGFPLLGDKLYHGDDQVFLRHYEDGMSPWILEQVGHGRCCLHAAKIGFLHPETKTECLVECELADDMKALLADEQVAGKSHGRKQDYEQSTR